MRRRDLAGTVAALVAVTLWINLGAIHRYQNADSLVMPLISIYRWTPLFWEQNRLGMLIPALATPFHHPLTNLLVQSGLTTLSGLSGFFLLGYYVAGRRRGLAAGSLGALLFVLATRLWQQFDYLIYIHQYATSLTLALLALIVLAHMRQSSWQRQLGWRRQGGWWRPIAAVSLIWLALWVNPSLAFALAPLVLLRPLWLRDAAAEFDRLDFEPLLIVVPEPDGSSLTDKQGLSPGRRRPSRRFAGYATADWIALIAIGSGLLVSVAISRYASTVNEPYRLLPPREWLACAVGILRNMPQALDSAWLAAVSVVAFSGLATLCWPAGRRSFPVSARLLLGLLLPAAVQFAFVAGLDHVHRTDLGRYAFAAVFLWQGACLLFAVVQWTAVLPEVPRVRAAPYAMLALFCVAAAVRHGRPGLDVVRGSLAEAAGKFTHEVLQQRCTHVTGDYYNVWPTVFYANLLLADQGSPYTVWGIAQRCLPTADRWTHVPLAETRIAEIIGDESHSERALKHYGITPLMVDYEGESIRVECPKTSLAETWIGRRQR
jgi:hypothetical protein